MEQSKSIGTTTLTDRQKTEWLLSLPIEHRVNRNGHIFLVTNINELTQQEIHSIASGYSFWKSKYPDI